MGARHIKRFNGGRSTPQEFHEQHAFPPTAKCSVCGGSPSVRAIVMVPSDEVEKRGMIPQGAGTVPQLFPELVPALVPIQDGGTKRWFIRTSVVYSCSRCQKAFEAALAKTPSWAIVEINRGPDPRNRVQVGVS